jgi:hypothetical protein
LTSGIEVVQITLITVPSRSGTSAVNGNGEVMIPRILSWWLALVLLGCMGGGQPLAVPSPPSAACDGRLATIIHNNTDWNLEVLVGWGSAVRVVEIVPPRQASNPVERGGEGVFVRVEGGQQYITHQQARYGAIRWETVCLKR